MSIQRVTGVEDTPNHRQGDKVILLIRLEDFYRAIAMQVFYQTKDFLRREPVGPEVRNKEYTPRSGGLIVSSSGNPELREDRIYLRGYASDGDSRIARMSFTNNKSRDDYIDKLMASLTDWANNSESWAPGGVVQNFIKADQVDSNARMIQFRAKQ